MSFKGMHLLFLICMVTILHATNYNAVYSEAYNLLEAGKHEEARSKFKIVADGPPETGLQDNAEYWIGNSYLRDGNYEEALKHYRRAQLLPDGSKHADAQFEMGRALTLAGDKVGAVIEYYKVLTLYPDANLTDRALARIDSLGDPTKSLLASKDSPESERPKPPDAKPDTIPGAKPPVQSAVSQPKEAIPSATAPAAKPTPSPKAAGDSIAGQPPPATSDSTAPKQTKVVEASTPSETKPAPKQPSPQSPPAAKPAGGAGSDSQIEGVSSPQVTYTTPLDSLAEADSQDVEGDTVWDQPDPSEREDGIKMLPLWADPRGLITPNDRRGF